MCREEGNIMVPESGLWYLRQVNGFGISAQDSCLGEVKNGQSFTLGLG